MTLLPSPFREQAVVGEAFKSRRLVPSRLLEFSSKWQNGVGWAVRRLGAVHLLISGNLRLTKRAFSLFPG
jgi:hypothetical protein